MSNTTPLDAIKRTGCALFIACATLLVSVTALAQDTDGDGLSDSDENNLHMTNPALVDTDGDGLSDSDELSRTNTNPLLKDSDNGGVSDYLEVLQGTDPNLQGDDDPALPRQGMGPASTWVVSPATMASIAASETRFQAATATNTRHFISARALNYSDQALPGPHTPFANHARSQDVWGGDPDFFVVSFYGTIFVPPATASNANNVFTFAASSDDGFILRLYNGATVQTQQFDANRGMGTGPLLTVDFPDEGGFFPFDYQTWEQGGAFGIALSWAPGTQTTFSTNTFSLVPAANYASPSIAAQQTVADVNGGTVIAGDELEYTVTLTNDGVAPAYNLAFEPRTLTNQTFGAYTQTPTTGRVDANNAQRMIISILNPGASVTLRYRTTTLVGTTYTAQGHISANSSPFAGVGQARIRALTDSPRRLENTDTANKPAALFPVGATDDDPNLVNLNEDISPPAIALQTPPNGAFTNDTTPTLSGTSEALATINVNLLDMNGATVQTLMTTANALGVWSVDAAALADGAYTVTATATDAANNTSAPAGPNTFTVDTLDPAISLSTPQDNDVLSDNTPTITGATEPGATVVIELLDDALNTIQTLTPMVNAQGGFSIDASVLPDGLYAITATATDAAGNQNATTVFIEIDTTAPAIALVAPSNNTQTQDNTPTLSGTTEAGASVVITLRDGNGAVVQTLNATADGAGDFSVDAAALPDGAYTATATATDDVGNTSAPAGPNAFIIDTTGPVIAFSSPNNGAQLNDPTPTLAGMTEPGATLTLTVLDDGGNVLETLTPMVNAQGGFSVDASALPEGDYTVNALATDALGNTNTTTITFTIDTTAPALSLDTPVDQSVSPQSSPTIEGSGEPGATVTVAVLDGAGNTVFSDVVTIDATGQWSAQVAMALADGTYTATATATDAAGNTSAPAGPNTFTVDTTAPTITLTNPAANATIANRRPNLAGTTEANLMVTLTLRDAQGMVVFTQTVTADAQGGFSATPNADLADGDYTLEAATSDAAGNSTTSSSSFTVNATALAIDLTTPADNAILSNTQPTLSGTTEANEAVVITVRDAQGMVILTQTVTANAQGDFSLTPAQALNDGVYTVSAAVTNAAGVTSTDSSSFTIDTTAPTLALTAPVAGSSTQDTTPTISGTTEPGAMVSVTLTDSNGATVQTLSATANAAGVFTVDAMTLAEGDYTVSATTADAAGNTASAGPNSFSVDTTAPALTFDAPTNGEVFGVRMVVASGTGEVGASVEVELKDMAGAVVATQTAVVDANGAWSVTFMGLANGTYDAQATSADAAGNEATASTQFSVDSDEPNLMVTAPAQDEVTNDDTPTLTGTADNDATVTIIIRDAQGNDVQTLTAPVDANGDWTIDATTLPEGGYTASVTATRPNGKSTKVDVDFSVDTTAPTLSLLTPAQDLVTSMTMLTATGKAEPGQEVTITVLDAQGQPAFTGTATADANGDWSLPLSSLADGAYTVEATTADAAGNSTTEGPNSFTIDTMAPTVTVTSPAPGSSSQDTTPTITGSAEPGATVEILVDGVKVGEAVADANGDWSLELTDALAPGDHTIEATSTDGAGNQGSSGQIDFTVTNPKAPVVITSPTDGGSVTGPSVTISGTGEPGDTITVTTGDKTETTTVAQDGTWMVTFDDLPEGDASITAQGDGSSAAVDITVELVDEPTPSGGFVVTGGAGCAQTPGAPLDLGLFATLGLMGFGLLRRRR